MNRRPTPETDKAKCKFTSLFGDNEDAYWVPLKVATTLEIERNELRSDLEFRRGLFQLQEQQLNEVRVERDEWKQKFIQQNKDLGCEMMDPGGTIWDYAKKLQDDIAGWETKWKCAVDMAARAEYERDEVKRKHLAEHDLANEAIATWKKTKEERDALQEQLDAAIMLGKMQERRHERDLEELIATAKAVIDRWETPFWKEAEHTGAYIAALRKAVEIAEGGYL